MGLYSWLEKKEGGFWGVVVIFAAFMIQIPSFGTAQSFGIYNMYLLRYFKDVSPAAVALIGSINVGVFLGSGPIATFLMNHMSHRKVALLGAILSSAGLIAMPFAPNLVYMYGFYGVLSGLGFCLVYVPSHVLSGLYYDEKRSLATGLATSGSGMGAIIFPLLVNFLVDTFGWRGSFYIVCGISMQNIVFASLLRPVPEKLKRRYKDAAKRREADPGDIEDTVTDSVKSKQEKQISTSTLQLLSVKSLAEKEKGDNEQLLTEDSKVPLSEDDIDLSLQEKLKQGSDQQSLKQDSNLERTKEDSNLENSKKDGSLRTPKQDSTLETSKEDTNFETSIQDSNLETPRQDSNLEKLNQGSDMQNSESKKETEEVIMASPIGSPAKLIKQESSENEEDALCKNNELPRNSLNEVEKLALNKKSTCSILCDYAFIIFFANNIFWNMGVVIILLFGPQYLLYVGLDEQSSALVFSIGGIGAFIGSILGGLLGNIKNLRLDIAYVIITVITGLICLIMPVPMFHSFGGLVFLYVAFSVMANMISGLLVVAVASIVGADAIGTGMGYIMLANGIGSIAAPPLIGWVYEVTGSPDVAFYIGGSFIIFAGLLIILIPVIDHFTEESKPTGKKPDQIQRECLNVYCM